MDQNILLVIFIILGYFFGSIPFGFIISKIKNIDIQKQGSGNIGATNVSRVLGFKYAILVGLLDILKVVFPAILAKQYLNNDWYICLAILAPILGHLFPVWLKFKGGKAVSGVFASMVVIIGWQYSLLFFLVWVIMLKIVKIMSLTNLIIIWFVPLLFWLFTHSIAYTCLGLLYVPILYWAHRENIKRLRAGKEKRIIKS
ncbi:MAG: glycerol-3-phosphate 1-O-acyltransferase PlsY [Candidatus Paceibacterota bacterium]|jgi:glycerol-3-phosphate acyltransferase PlsY